MDPIFRAVLQGREEVARLLRSAPGCVHVRMSADELVESIPHWLYLGDTSLHLAAAALRPEEARLLIQAGADPNAENRRGATPLHYCCDPRPQAGPWSREAQTGLIRLLVEHGADRDRADRGGATPLHRAVRARSPGAVRQLLELGARIDGRLRKGGSSPLHLAVQPTGAGGTAGAVNEQLEIIALLVQRGADPALGDASGRTPRDWARSERILLALNGGDGPGPRGGSGSCPGSRKKIAPPSDRPSQRTGPKRTRR